MPPPLVEIVGVSKGFLGVQALSDVSLDLRAGEVHAIVGENGAGKSTLIKTLTGIHQPDAGEIVVDGVVRRFSGPADAKAAGITAVDGDFELGDTVSVITPAGVELARGLVAYPAGELRKISGLQSAAIEATLGYKSTDEAIHRDDLVIL